MQPTSFAKKVAKLTKLNDTMVVVDYGCGTTARDSVYFAKKAAVVFAVDRKPIDTTALHVIRSKADMVTALLPADVYYLCNSLQFVPKAKAKRWLKKLYDALPTGGYLAVRTFTKAPKPAFKITSTWSYDDLYQGTDRTLYIKEWTETSPDLNGTIREFFMIDVIYRK